MKVNVSYNKQTKETIENSSSVSSANKAIMDVAFNLQNITLRKLESIHCDKDNEINLLLYYDSTNNIKWALQGTICDNCKLELKKILESTDTK